MFHPAVQPQRVRSKLFGSITGIWSVSPLLRVKIVHLLDRSDLFKISNLVYEGREVIKSQYCSLQGQRVFGGYSELTVSMLSVSKLMY